MILAKVWLIIACVEGVILRGESSVNIVMSRQLREKRLSSFLLIGPIYTGTVAQSNLW